jgi:hypothetical protein
MLSANSADPRILASERFGQMRGRLPGFRRNTPPECNRRQAQPQSPRRTNHCRRQKRQSPPRHQLLERAREPDRVPSTAPSKKDNRMNIGTEVLQWDHCASYAVNKYESPTNRCDAASSAVGRHLRCWAIDGEGGARIAKSIDRDHAADGLFLPRNFYGELMCRLPGAAG